MGPQTKNLEKLVNCWLDSSKDENFIKLASDFIEGAEEAYKKEYKPSNINHYLTFAYIGYLMKENPEKLKKFLED